MFDDDQPGDPFERWLQDAHDGDERAQAAARADVAAMVDHRTTDATGQHEIIARLVWRTLRDLGVVGGRMLVLGQDPEVFAGLPADDRRLSPGDANGFTATIPATPSHVLAPHPRLPLRLYGEDSPRQYDVVIAVAPHADVILHREGVSTSRRVAQTLGIIGALANTEPGGFTVALASKEFLDDPDDEGRNLVTELGELVGAVRLPAGALRPNPGNDACVDLAIWRRHVGSPVEPHVVLPSIPQVIGGQQVHLNQYYVHHPAHLLGRLTVRPDPWGPTDTTVLPSPLGLRIDLSDALVGIVEHAHTVGLTAQTSATIEAHLAGASPENVDEPIPYVPTDPAPADAGLAEVDLDTVRHRIERLRIDVRLRGSDGLRRPKASGSAPSAGQQPPWRPREPPESPSL